MLAVTCAQAAVSVTPGKKRDADLEAKVKKPKFDDQKK